jgi:hypothetical protein
LATHRQVAGFDRNPRPISSEFAVNVTGVSIVTLTLTRTQLRDWLKKCGRIGDGADAKLTGADREKLSK